MRSIAATSVPLPGWRDLWRVARANLDWLAASAASVTLYIWRDPLSQGFASKRWDLGAYYSALFDWSSVQAAFLFGVYAFFLSRSEPFIQAIAGSSAFRDLRLYVVRTLYLSMSLSVLSLPSLVAPVAIEKGGSGVGYAIFLGLSALLTYTFFCFLKVIRVFGKIERRS